MSGIKQAIEEYRRKQTDPNDMRGALKQIAYETVLLYVPMIKEELLKELERYLKEYIDDRVKQELKGEKGDDGYSPKKFKDYFTEEEIRLMITEISARIPIPNDGADADEEKIIAELTNRLPKPETIVEKVLVKIPPPKDEKPQEIASKLNTLEEVIEPKTIKGFKKIIENLKANIRGSRGGGGGGVGNTQHETKNVSSSTTTITTTYPIAGGGYDIQAFYNGQFIVRGTHYTVGSDFKTLTLTLTLQDNTQIDLVYRR